jgi:hemoglobin
MPNTLYNQLGGIKGITRIVDHAVSAHSENPILTTRFASAAAIEHAKKVSIDFFCEGVLCPHTCRDITNKELIRSISEQEFIDVVDDIICALDKNTLDANTKKDVLTIFIFVKREYYNSLLKIF